MMKQQNIEEGDTAFKEGLKALKTTMFKWKPDFELAAEKLDQAGSSFKLAKEYDRSIDAFKQAADAHKSYLSLFHCAKSLESAANAARDGKKMPECNALLTQAAYTYRRNGTPDAAALALEKAAKDAEKENHIEVAMNLYLEVVDIRETEDQMRRVKVPLDKAVQMSIRCKKFKLTMEHLNKEAILLTQLKDDPMMNRNWMCRIIVQLAVGDFEMAEQIYEEAMCSPAFNGCDEMYACNEMLDAYDAKDQETLSKVTKQQIFSFLSNDSALLARKLVAKGGTGRTVKTLGDLGITDPGLKKGASKPKSKPTPTPATSTPTSVPEPTQEPKTEPTENLTPTVVESVEEPETELAPPPQEQDELAPTEPTQDIAADDSDEDDDDLL